VLGACSVLTEASKCPSRACRSAVSGPVEPAAARYGDLRVLPEQVQDSPAHLDGPSREWGEERRYCTRTSLGRSARETPSAAGNPAKGMRVGGIVRGGTRASSIPAGAAGALLAAGLQKAGPPVSRRGIPAQVFALVLEGFDASRLRDFEHVLRVAAILAFGLVAFIAVRSWLVPDDFGVYGFFRAGALDDNRAHPSSTRAAPPAWSATWRSSRRAAVAGTR